MQTERNLTNTAQGAVLSTFGQRNWGCYKLSNEIYNKIADVIADHMKCEGTSYPNSGTTWDYYMADLFEVEVIDRKNAMILSVSGTFYATTRTTGDNISEERYTETICARAECVEIQFQPIMPDDPEDWDLANVDEGALISALINQTI